MAPTPASTRWAWRRTATASDVWYDKAKQTLRLQFDRPIVLRQAIMACRKGGTVSVPGVYGGFIDKMPDGRIHE